MKLNFSGLRALVTGAGRGECEGGRCVSMGKGECEQGNVSVNVWESQNWREEEASLNTCHLARDLLPTKSKCQSLLGYHNAIL